MSRPLRNKRERADFRQIVCDNNGAYLLRLI